MHRRLVLAAALGSLAAPGILRAQGAFPNRPIRVVSPFAPGGTSDGAIRAMNPVLERVLGHAMVVDNRPGAGGTVGTAHIAGERPDGYSLVLAMPARSPSRRRCSRAWPTTWPTPSPTSRSSAARRSSAA